MDDPTDKLLHVSEPIEVQNVPVPTQWSREDQVALLRLGAAHNAIDTARKVFDHFCELEKNSGASQESIRAS